MGVIVKNINFIYDDSGISHITCDLENNKFFDIELYDFYYWLIKKDKKLNDYSSNFDDWTTLTEDLFSLSFDFLSNCQLYINSEFTETEINEFTY